MPASRARSSRAERRSLPRSSTREDSIDRYRTQRIRDLGAAVAAVASECVGPLSSSVLLPGRSHPRRTPLDLRPSGLLPPQGRPVPNAELLGTVDAQNRPRLTAIHNLTRIALAPRPQMPPALHVVARARLRHDRQVPPSRRRPRLARPRLITLDRRALFPLPLSGLEAHLSVPPDVSLDPSRPVVC